jgi:hypothetical protein
VENIFYVEIKFGEDRVFNFRKWKGKERRMLVEAQEKETPDESFIIPREPEPEEEPVVEEKEEEKSRRIGNKGISGKEEEEEYSEKKMKNMK